MLIANPIYDSVFKYLMEDLDIAKGLLSEILGREIISLAMRPQETVVETPWKDILLKVYRLDFKAVIKDKDGTEQKILIELQKSKAGADVQRFRHYLAQNYRNMDGVEENGESREKPLEIVTVYFLGFRLDNIDVPVLWVKNDYINLETGQSLAIIPNEPFIRLLNHESYTIQIPLLTGDFQTNLLRMLKVFSQEYRTSNWHLLDYKGGVELPLISLILSRLNRAVANETIQKQMDIEDEMQRTYLKSLQEMSERVANAEKEKDEAIEKAKKQTKAAQKKAEAAQKKVEAAQKEKEVALKKVKQSEIENQAFLSKSIHALFATGMSAELIADALNLEIEIVSRFLHKEP